MLETAWESRWVPESKDNIWRKPIIIYKICTLKTTHGRNDIIKYLSKDNENQFNFIKRVKITRRFLKNEPDRNLKS